MAVRVVKLILISAFYIGLLDTPLFAPGVGNIGPFQLDNHPIQFRKDLLLHDAHRHPYIERLGVIYILKLRYGDAFGTRAGGAWCLIFVMALMPRLCRYRLDDVPIIPQESNGQEVERFFDEYSHLWKGKDVDREVEMKNNRSNQRVSFKEVDELARLRKNIEELEAQIEGS